MIYHLTWGRAIFAYFTEGGLKPHWHQFSQVITQFDLKRLFTVAIEYIHCAANFFNGSYLMLGCFVTFLTYTLIKSSNINKMRNFLIVLWLLLSGYVILLALCVVHTPINDYYDLWDSLWDSMYILAPAAFLLATTCFIFLECATLSEYRWTKYLRYTVICFSFMFLITSAVYIPSYRTKFMQPFGGYAPNAGFMSVNENNEIIITEIPVEEFIAQNW